MADPDAPRRRWPWILGYAAIVAALVGTGALFLPYIPCPSCAGQGRHRWQERDYPCLVCDGARRISGLAWIRAVAR